MNTTSTLTHSISATNGIAILKMRLTIKEVCQMLSIERDKLNKMVKNDPNFPRPIKEGNTRQAAVYFDHSELIEWWNEKKLTRFS